MTEVPAPQAARARWLLPAILGYAAASAFHHVHNAAQLAAYPNLPAWLSPADVYMAWGATTAIGVAGYLALRAGFAVTGLTVLGLYAAAGLAGLDHYVRAPFAAHSFMMNLSIGCEVATALTLLGVIAARLVALLRGRQP
jgi:hypothetical protein